MERKARHPSEKPIRRDVETRLSIPREPYDQPLTPGLRRRSGASAIGFMARICDEAED